MKKTVALIYGGEGCEREISIASAENLSKLIDREKFEVVSVMISESGEWFIESGGTRESTFPIFLDGVSGLYKNGGVLKTDAAVPCLHGDFGEDGNIAGALRTAHIPFVGKSILAGAVCADKIVTKSVADSLGIPTAKWIFSNGREPTETVRRRAEERLGYPMFIKPASTGSSIGITRVSSREQFADAYRDALSYTDRVLIEEALDVVSEIECAYLELCKISHFALGTVNTDGEFYDYKEKYAEESKIFACPVCIADEDTKDAVISMSKKLRSALSVRDIGRFDFFLTRGGEVIFNEINTFPGMTDSSLYPSLTLNMGLTRGEFINLLLSETIYDRRI